MSSKLSLTHELTPPALADLNQQLEILISAEELESPALLQLVQQRDQLISTLNEEFTDVSQKRAFLEQEALANNLLTEHIQQMRQETENRLTKIVRGQKAIKKYK